MIERDNLHFTFREIDGYNKIYNIVFCEREAGKTTSIELDKILYPFLNYGRTCCYIVRKAIEITDDLINSIESRINRFLSEPIHFLYSKREFRDGCVSLYLLKDKKKELVMKIVSLGMELQRLKKIAIPNIHAIVFDEYVCNPKFNEKYVKGEAFKLKELYITLKRFEWKDGALKCYFCGNPYSKFTPIIMDLGVNTNLMKRGARIVGDTYIVECYSIKQELRDKLLKANPLYQFDETYKRYAFDGEYINDSRIKIGELPNDYRLKFVFNISGKYLGIYKNNYIEERRDKFFVRFINFSEVRKTSYCFEFDDLMKGSVLMGHDERQLFTSIKSAMRERRIAFANIECYYLMEEIYKNL